MTAQSSGHQPTAATARKQRMVVDAIMIPAPLLEVHLAAKNIIDFFAECIEDCIDENGNARQSAALAIRCRENMSRIQKMNAATLRPSVSEIIQEFLMEFDAIRPRLSALAASGAPQAAENQAFIEAKIYKIKYLSAILGNEIGASRAS